MSWFDRDPGVRRARALLRVSAAALAGAVLLAGCTVQPLYAPSAVGPSVSAALTNIAIDPVDERIAQQVRNRLIFTLGGGNPPANATYRMHLTVTSNVNALGVTPVESAPAYSVTVSVTYAVTSIASGEIVTRGTVRGTASFDRTTQIYANTRAQRDAENRAAGLAADDIRVRLASAATRGKL